jgi:hypothetical protein
MTYGKVCPCFLVAVGINISMCQDTQHSLRSQSEHFHLYQAYPTTFNTIQGPSKHNFYYTLNC